MKCEALAEEYARLWSAMELKPSMAKGCDYGAAKILSGRDRYEAVSLKTGVPWHVIGLIHLMEAGARFDRHLHNGDALTRRTVQVPKGRPATGDGPFTWEESAIDALCFDKLEDRKSTRLNSSHG